MEYSIGLLLFIFFTIVITIFITRWIFGIDTIIKQLKLNNSLLKMIAEKEGLLNDKWKEFIDKTIGKI